MKERWKLILLLAIFGVAYYLPVDYPRFRSGLIESIYMVKEYARLHVLTCLVPAFFIAGAIAVFISQAAVLKYFGAKAKKVLAYSVASVSGAILAVCSCTVLPLFAGIYTRGAGVGPATAFLYSGPAINVLAIILTARVLGVEMGLARALGAVLFAVVIGLIMAFMFKRDDEARLGAGEMVLAPEDDGRPLWQQALYFFSMVAVLVFGAWGRPSRPVGFFNAVFKIKWYLAGGALALLFLLLYLWFTREELSAWVDSTWGFVKQILPLLFAGVVVAGLLLGRPEYDNGLIPGRFIASLVGGNGLGANLIASVSGALMYFATLTEVPILEGLLGAGMGKGPALALLLAGPALSLPNMIVIRAVMGTKKTLVFIGLVVAMSTIAGLIFGAVAG